jgi:hypothetical protein
LTNLTKIEVYSLNETKSTSSSNRAIVVLVGSKWNLWLHVTAEYTTEAHEYPHPPPHQPQLSSVTGTWAIREKVSYETDEFMQQLHPEIVGLWIEKEVT